MSENIKEKMSQTIEALVNGANPVDYPKKISELDANTLVFERDPAKLTAERNKITEGASESAKQVMDSMLKTYVSAGFIEQSQYVRAKLAINTSSLSSIIKQIRICETAIEVLMSSIESGDDNPKLFDALSSLQKTMIELIKNQQVLVTAVESDYKHIGDDLDKHVSDDDSDDDSQGFKINDPRNLLRAIQSAIKPEDQPEPEPQVEPNTDKYD